jgi:hypothetical protein
MIKAIARGRAWFEEIATGEARSLQELAKREGISRRYIRRLVALAFFLSPQLIKAILQGRQSVALTTTRLTELARRDPPGFRHFMVSRPRKSGSHKTLRWRETDSNIGPSQEPQSASQQMLHMQPVGAKRTHVPRFSPSPHSRRRSRV